VPRRTGQRQRRGQAPMTDSNFSIDVAAIRDDILDLLGRDAGRS
jgi:hypothetical protein